MLHSPFGLRVHAPWALAVGARLLERYGVESHPTPSDDGIIVRLPDTDDAPPGSEIFVFDTEEIDDIVTEQVGGSALFASRFRECAARALLLPRRNPGKRAPLWQQRQRSAQLLDVARRYPDFPILLETVRECLQDVYDLPALRDLLGSIAQRRIRLVEVETPTASPFATSLLFSYVASSCTRATARSPNVGRRHCRSTRRCSPNSSAGSSCANCSTPTSSPRPSTNCNA